MDFILGKKEYEHDERTLMLARYVLPEVHVPDKWDFDVGRHGIPLRMWGNDGYGDCVIAGQANHLLRLERIEQRATVPLSDDDVLARYKALTGCQRPGDALDTGLYVIDAMKNWRNSGWHLPPARRRADHTYKIHAYGELDPGDPAQLRMASYLFHGIHLGFSLPLVARSMTDGGVWDYYKGETGPQWRPGSWGGHLVYSKAFDLTGLEILTWGKKIRVTDSFVEHYCDEAWALVDDLDKWRARQVIDVETLEAELRQVAHNVPV